MTFKMSLTSTAGIPLLMSPDEFLNAFPVVGRTHLYAAITEGRLEVSRVGRKILISKDSAMRFLGLSGVSA